MRCWRRLPLNPLPNAGWSLAILVATTVLGITWQVLPRNHRPGEDEIFARFGAGTWLTLLSGLLLAYVAGFLFSPWPGGWLAWLPALLYLASRIVDLFDGYLARMSDHVTDAGAALDIELDGLGLLIAVGLGVWYGQLPAWYLILAVSRQLFVAGIWWRTHRDKPVYQLPPSDNRRIIAGCQTGFIAIVLWPVLSPPATMLAAVLFAIPLVASFGRDWLVVSGVIDADSAAYHLWRNRIKRVVEWWLPFAARVAGALAGATMLARAAPQFTTWEVYLYATGMQNIRLAPWLIALVFAASLVLFALGIAGRVASLFVIGLAVLDMQACGTAVDRKRPAHGLRHPRAARRQRMLRPVAAGRTLPAPASWTAGTRPAMMRLRRLAQRYGSFVVAVALLWLVLRSVSLPPIWHTLSRLQVHEVLILVIVNGLLLLAMTARWWLLLFALGHSIPYLKLSGYRLTAFGISYFTPGPHFGGEPYQVYAVAKHHNVPYADSIAAVSLDKLLEMLINFTFLAAAAFIVLPATVGHGPLDRYVNTIALAMICLPAAILAALWRGGHPFSGAIVATRALWHSLTARGRRGRREADPRWLQTVRGSEDQIARICRTRPAILLGAVAASVLTWIGVIGEYWLTTLMLDLRSYVQPDAGGPFRGAHRHLAPIPCRAGRTRSEPSARHACRRHPAWRRHRVEHRHTRP